MADEKIHFGSPTGNPDLQKYRANNRGIRCLLPNLERARIVRGMTQQELFEKTGIARTTISRAEKIKCKLVHKNALLLCDALGYELWQLMSNNPADLSDKIK